jgi:hypothetical protein
VPKPLQVSRVDGVWLRADGGDLPVDVYFRCKTDEAERLFVCAMHVDATLPVTAATLRQIPIGRLEAAINARPPLRELALESATKADRVSMGPRRSSAGDPIPIAADASRAPLTRPDGTNPEEFYALVAQAYLDLVAHTNRPAVEIADEANVPVATARRWIHEARRRGALPHGHQGRAQ